MDSLWLGPIDSLWLGPMDSLAVAHRLSLAVAHVLSLAGAHGLSGCGPWAPALTGSVDEVQGCCAASLSSLTRDRATT